jgi:hypothetical protein
MKDLIPGYAERKSYGVRPPKDAVLYEDESEDALWCWELFNTNMLPASLSRDL